MLRIQRRRLVAFAADDSNSYTSSGSYHGPYASDLGSHSISKIADVNSSLSGLGPLRNIAPTGVAVSQGNVLFLASDTSGAQAMYLWKDRVPTKIIGNGDTLDDIATRFPVMVDPGPSALFGASFAFNPSRLAVYLATAPEDVRVTATPTAVPAPSVTPEPTDTPD